MSSWDSHPSIDTKIHIAVNLRVGHHVRIAQITHQTACTPNPRFCIFASSNRAMMSAETASDLNARLMTSEDFVYKR